MNTHKVIADVNELKWFYNNVLPPLEPTEVYFVSLSARNKYLTDEEKNTFQLGRNEMFAKSLIREQSWERFYRTLRRLECHEDGFTTKNGLPIPDKTLVCYININPSNTIKALNGFQKIINEYMFELSQVALERRDPENILNRINKIDNNLLTEYQQATGTRHYLDFDLDVDKSFKPHEDVVLRAFMKDLGLKTYFWIDTKSGYHLLLKKNEVHFNPHDLVNAIVDNYKANYTTGDKFEVKYNTDAMCPCPGCFQGGHQVTVLNKEIVVRVTEDEKTIS